MRRSFVEILEKRTLLNGTISGIVFDDLNGNGRLDAGEPGLVDQRVYLDTNNNGQFDRGEPFRISDTTGAYLFSKLDHGSYRVRHEVPDGRRLSSPEAIFYDVNVTAFGSGSTVATSRNFGNTTTAVIRGSVWHDINGNGQRDSGEVGLEGWTIFLDKNGDGIYQPGKEKVRVTNSRGDYRFAGLTPGTYVIRIVQSPQYKRTTPIDGGYTVKLAEAQGISNRIFGEKDPEVPRP